MPVFRQTLTWGLVDASSSHNISLNNPEKKYSSLFAAYYGEDDLMIIDSLSNISLLCTWLDMCGLSDVPVLLLLSLLFLHHK